MSNGPDRHISSCSCPNPTSIFLIGVGIPGDVAGGKFGLCDGLDVETKEDGRRSVSMNQSHQTLDIICSPVTQFEVAFWIKFVQLIRLLVPIFRSILTLDTCEQSDELQDEWLSRHRSHETQAGNATEPVPRDRSAHLFFVSLGSLCPSVRFGSVFAFGMPVLSPNADYRIACRASEVASKFTQVAMPLSASTHPHAPDRGCQYHDHTTSDITTADVGLTHPGRSRKKAPFGSLNSRSEGPSSQIHDFAIYSLYRTSAPGLSSWYHLQDAAHLRPSRGNLVRSSNKMPARAHYELPFISIRMFQASDCSSARTWLIIVPGGSFLLNARTSKNLDGEQCRIELVNSSTNRMAFSYNDRRGPTVKAHFHSNRSHNPKNREPKASTPACYRSRSQAWTRRPAGSSHTRLLAGAILAKVFIAFCVPEVHPLPFANSTPPDAWRLQPRPSDSASAQWSRSWKWEEEDKGCMNRSEISSAPIVVGVSMSASALHHGRVGEQEPRFSRTSMKRYRDANRDTLVLRVSSDEWV
ncbi:hypothetical protein BXZ70DRAFT_910902 [Cristinia sonorae]|uniref:Uncharacterized protein n=1 Tax=Cristinia sonorae TaxID=1940300 RepID=A0A8K0UEB6_9AGAR|nr:hypothetical protein BXZ70DRAFT_910902 [Cristinia sonorae]